MTAVVPFGAWPSIVSPADVVGGASVPTALAAGDGIAWWSETRPSQGGREAIVRRDGDGTLHEVLPPGFNVRTRVHEYGGGAWWVHQETVFATSWEDQRIYRVDPAHEPTAISPDPPSPHAWRYADGRVTPDGRWVVCVRERHDGPDVATDVHNEIVAVPADGSSDPIVLYSDTDFVAAPRISRDGRQLAWIAWNHPNMPWDSTELWVGRLDEHDGLLHLSDSRREAGGAGESLVQPEWGRHATLYVCSDRSGWWNVHRVDGVDRLSPVVSTEAEVSAPAWVFGQSRYVVRHDGTVVTVHARGRDTLLTRVAEAGPESTTTLSEQGVTELVDDGSALVATVGFPDRPTEVHRLTTESDEAEVVRPGAGGSLPQPWIAVPQHIRFPTDSGDDAFGWFYPPTNPNVVPEPGTLPPLLVWVHGGPTSAARPEFSLARQFWTSRGFALVDVDYRGSTGYGRPFRELLRGEWGVADVADAAAAAAFLAGEGLVDPDRIGIRGGSAGGLTTLLATLLGDQFSAGVSYFGVADMAALIAETHKFESRYLDSMVGPMPEAADRVRDRSPLTHAEKAHVPTLVMQGLEDVVVPPAQAEAIVAALAANEVPHAYLPFAGEQHGFRISANQIRALESELSFYGLVFGVTPADDLEPLTLEFEENLPR